MRRWSFVTLFGVSSLFVSAVPSPAEDATPADPPESGSEWDIGDLSVQEALIPPCDDPPCEPTTQVSGGYGGYIAVEPVRIFDTQALIGGATGRLEAGRTVSMLVAGEGGVPAEGVGAIVLNLTATGAQQKSAITVWPTGSEQPATENLSVEPGRTRTATVVVSPGDGGQVSLRARQGRVHLAVDVLGWFPVNTDVFPIEPQRILDDVRFEADETVEVQVSETIGVPGADVGAVILNVTAARSNKSSAITFWMTGDARPEVRHLTTEPGRSQSNLVVVPPNEAGLVSIHNESGRTDLTVDVMGWIQANGSYRTPVPGVLFDSRTDTGSRLAPGAPIDVQVSGRNGVPTDDDPDSPAAQAVVLSLTAFEPDGGSTVTVWPTGDNRPDTTSLATSENHKPTTTLAIVELGSDGQLTVAADTAPTHLRVELIGWFANPIALAELAVPESTKIPEEEDVESVTISGDGTALVVLDADSKPVAAGEHLVLGVTPSTPEGMLAKVTGVTTVDGSQLVTTEPARLEEVFPEGEIVVDLGEADFVVEQVYASNGLAFQAMATTSETPDKGVKVDFEFEGDGEGTCDRGDDGGIGIDFGPLFDMQFAVKWRWFKAPVVTALATLGAEAELTLKEVFAECGWSVDLMKATVTFTAGPVPVVVVFEVGASLDIEAGLTGVELAAGARAWITMGVLANKAHLSGGAELWAPTLDETLLQARDLEIFAMADVWLDFGVKLYAVIGPTMSVGPFLETFVTTNPDKPWWAMDFGLAGKIGLDLDLWFKSWSWDLWEGEIPLAEWVGLEACTQYGPGLGGRPCRTPAKGVSGFTRPNDATRNFQDRIRLISSGRALFELQISPITLPEGIVGEPYPAQQLQATGLFSNDATWHLVGEGVPGLTFDEATGVISGVPTAEGSFKLVIQLWYGPEPEGGYPRDSEDEDGDGDRDEYIPVYGPVSPPQVTLEVSVAPDANCWSRTVTDPGDDGRPGQLRQELAAVCDGGTIDISALPIIELERGELVVDKTVTIVGSGEFGPNVIDANGLGRVFNVRWQDDGGDLTLTDVHVTGGNAAEGGGIAAAGGSVTLDGSTTVSGNQAISGGGIWLEYGELTMNGHAIVTENTASWAGGGVYSDNSNVQLNDWSRITANVSSGSGGGVYNYGWLVLNDESAIQHNEAGGGGGGVLLFELGLTLNDRSTIASNHAGESGGGVSMSGMFPWLTLNHDSAITGNVTLKDGGGVAIYEGDLLLNDRSEIRLNAAGERGGGVAILEGSPYDVPSVTMAGDSAIRENTASIEGGGIHWPVGDLFIGQPASVLGNSPDDYFPAYPG